MLDIGLLIYAALLVLAIWRFFCFYWCCGIWLSIVNYVALLYIILGGTMVYLTVSFYDDAQKPPDIHQYPELTNLWDIKWLKPFTLAAPAAVVATMGLNWLQTESHVFEIHKRSAETKHDRAIQIVTLPTVFGVMCLASMLPIYALLTGTIDAKMLMSPWHDYENPFALVTSYLLMQVQGLPGILAGNFSAPMAGASTTTDIPAAWDEAKRLAFWRHDTCFYVADSFEAWVLFQFGKLVLEQVGETIAIKGEEREEDEESITAKLKRDIVDSHEAVTALTWIGTSMFVVVCILQSAMSLWPYLGGSQQLQETIMFHLEIAGFVTSCAAIYDLVVVEQAFHRHLSPISPVLKFLTVKFLVSLSFMQKGLIAFGKFLIAMTPEAMQRVLGYVPILGDILSMTELQFHLFYSALVIFECLFLALVHLCVWRSSEIWYRETGTENEPLAPKTMISPPTSVSL